MSSDTNCGTGYYLSSVGGRGGGGGLKTLAGFSGGTTQICLKNQDVGGGGSRKSSEVTRGDHFGEATFKGGIG